jgi:hypothetical protein
MEKRFKKGDTLVCTTDEFLSVSDCGLFSFTKPEIDGIYEFDRYHEDSERYIYLKDGGGSHCWDEAGFDVLQEDVNEAVLGLLKELDL